MNFVIKVGSEEITIVNETLESLQNTIDGKRMRQEDFTSELLELDNTVRELHGQDARVVGVIY